jgi:hypothetical protein
LSYFLQLTPGDIIAIKSHGQYGNLTICAYAEVKEVAGKVYEHDGAKFPNGLGQIIHVAFLEKNLNIETKLNYAQTIHQIIPEEKKWHFEKIFGSFSSLESNIDETTLITSLKHNGINDKQTGSSLREVSYTTLVSKTHDKIQIAFAKKLEKEFPNDNVATEVNYIDIIRENETELYLYEVKPYNSAYHCIRAGIGQLIDYCYSNPNRAKTIHLRIVGTAKMLSNDKEFIDFIKSNLKLSFDYISFNQLT